ncbi:hypothetical protein GCM10009690_13560 [Brevibacterium permense]|uniref:Uncharacterized protein n=2 Tax=Brevibacterium permense TaxID=234834 RepID=A0ABN2A601_9MICO
MKIREREVRDKSDNSLIRATETIVADRRCHLTPRLSSELPVAQLSRTPKYYLGLRCSLVGMCTGAFGYMERLETALNLRGNPLGVDAFMDILREMSDAASAPLSGGERGY